MKKIVTNRSQNISSAGFTLVEVLIVIGIMGLLLGASVPFGLNFYDKQRLNATSQQTLQLLREAQLKAMSGQASSEFGVYIDEAGGIVYLFEGGSYNEEDILQSFSVPPEVDFRGYGEIVFSRIEGSPNTTGDLEIIFNEKRRVISTNDAGKIELQ